MINEELCNELENFTCIHYNSNGTTCSVNELRYKLFCARGAECKSHLLPPCRDCLYKHIIRANYQTAIWKRSLEKQPNIPNPSGHGWKYKIVNNEKILNIDWMSGEPAPKAVLDLLACDCSRICKAPDCICITNNLKCTPMCKLDCDNQKISNDDEDENEQDDVGDIDFCDFSDDEF